MSNPLSLAGLSVDMETGKPVNRKIRNEKILQQGNDLLADLSQEGGAVVRETINLFIKRVNQLIADDLECSVYRKLLDSIGMKLNAARKIVKSQVDEDLKEHI